MSSNLKTKNLVYSFNKHNELPYKSSSTVEYNDSDQYLNMVQLNNTYGQCIDNDMFIAKNLIGQINGTSQPGPKLLVDKASIDALPDGAKFFNTAGSSNIMQKHVNSLDNSIQKSNDTNFSSINFMHKINSQMVLVCTSQKTFVITVDDIKENGTIADVPEVKAKDGESFVVTAVFQYGKFSTTMFAGHSHGRTDNGIYILRTYGYSRDQYIFEQLYALQDTNDEICAIASDDSSSTIAFATRQMLYACNIHGESINNVKGIVSFSSSSTGLVCALATSSSNATVFTDTGKIYNASYAEKYYGLISLERNKTSDNSIAVNDVQYANGIQYFATNIGLCAIKNGQLQQINENYANEVKHVAVDSIGRAWCGDSAGRILVSSSPNDLEQYTQLSSRSISNFMFINDVKFIMTGNGLMYESKHKVFSNVANAPSGVSLECIIKRPNTSNEVFVVGAKNGNTLYAAYARIEVGDNTYDYDYANGMHASINFNQSAYSSYNADVVKLVHFNGHDYAFVNFISKNSSAISYYEMLDASTGESFALDTNGQLVQGIMQVSDNDMYIFTTSVILRLHLPSNSVEKQLFNNPFGVDATIIDSQPIDENNYFITAFKSGAYVLAYVELNQNGIQIKDTVKTGIFSNVIEYNDDYLAIAYHDNISELSSFNVSYVMNDQDISSNASFPNVLSNETRAQFQMYLSNDFQIVNNLSYRIDGSVLYRRSDYIVPHGSSNIVALQSFIQISHDEEPVAYLQCMSSYQIAGTGDVSFVDSASDYQNSSTATGYIKGTSAVYTFQTDDESSKIFNPSSPFTATYKVVNQNAAALAIERVSIDKNYLNSNLTSYDAQLTSYEIKTNKSLSAVTCHQQCTYGEGIPQITSEVYSVNDLNGSIPLMMSRYIDKVYVLLSSGVNTYSVKSIEHTGNSYRLSDIYINDIHNDNAPVYFGFSYKSNFNEMLSYLDDEDISDIKLNNEHNFLNVIALLSSSGYTYETDHEMSQTAQDGVMNIVFKTAVYTADFYSDYHHSQTISTCWRGTNAYAAVNANQVDSIVENALLTFNAFGAISEMPMLFKSNATSPLYALSNNKVIYGNDSLPASMRNIDFIGKDNVLGYRIMSNHGRLSAIGQDSTVKCKIQLNQSARDISLIQCYDKSFNNLPCIICTTYDSSTGIYETAINKINASNNIVQTDIIMTSFLYNKLLVLNVANDVKYPVMSYSKSIGTLEYEKYYNNVKYNIFYTASLAVAPSIKCIAVDAFNGQYKNICIINGNKLYQTSFSTSQNINKIADFNAHEIANVSFAAFAGDMFGDGRCALVNATMNDGTSKTFSVHNDYPSQVILVDELNSSIESERELLNSSYRFMQYDSGTYVLYVIGSDSKSYMLQFTGTGMINDFIQFTQSELDSNNTVHSIVKLNNANEYALQTTHGIYKCIMPKFIQSLDRVFTTTDSIGFIAPYEDEMSYFYFISQNAKVLSSSSLSAWKTVLTVGQNSSDAFVNAFTLLNPYIALASRNDSIVNSLYYTYYNYTVDSNTQQFTAESAYYAYYDNLGEIDEINNGLLNEHIEYHHLANGADISFINNCMDRDFQLPSDFMQSNGGLDFSNDYIDKILVGNSYDDNIIVYACNSVSDHKWNQLTCNYIAKCWKSGLTELYINIPTTLTYYIPHIEGASQCNGYDEQIDINGRTLTSNVKDNVTSVRINLASAYFNVSTLAENTIKANSLPLNVFKDDTYEDACTGAMWHSFVCPSVAESFNPSDIFLGYSTFNYYCFGSDSQAVKLTFMNNNPNYDRKYKTIVYHANGGTIAKFPGMKQVTQRIYEDDDPVDFYGEIFSKEGSFFVGWSQSSGALEGDNAYSSDNKISYKSMKLMKLTLYACWISYKFGSNDTTLTIANTTPGDYTIAEITIDPNVEIPNNPQLGNKLIIDYGG